MIITNPRDLSKYRAACALSVDLLHQIYSITKPGVTTLELDQYAGKILAQNQVRSSFFGVKGEYGPYRYNMCIAVNDVIVHGVPNKTMLQPGDIVKLDFGIIKDGYFTDHCVTVILDKPRSQEELDFVNAAKSATLQGVAQAANNLFAGDIGSAMHTYLRERGYDVAKEYIGHGIGKTLHDKPAIPAYGRPGIGAQLKSGMVICVEAQVVQGSDRWFLDKDGWTVRTKDGKQAAMFEYMTLVGDKPEIMTDTTSWEIVI